MVIMDINTFLIDSLIQGKENPRMRRKIRKIMFDYDEAVDIDEFCFEGVLKSSVLEVLLHSDSKPFGLELANWALFHFGGKETISNVAFSKILSLRGNLGRSILMNLEHVPLAFYQLVELCKNENAGMIFDILLPVLCEHDCFTSNDVRYILSQLNAKPALISMAIEHTKKLCGCSDKLEMVEKYYEELLTQIE